MDNALAVHPLFVALTRPPMRFGVTVNCLMLNGAVSLTGFVLSTSFSLLFLLAILLHVMGYLCCLVDPRIFDLLFGKYQVMANNRNTGYWGCTSYDPF